MKARQHLIFALHATSRGFSYVAFEGPFSPYDWSTVVVRGDKNAACLRRLEKLLDRLQPISLLLEEPSSVANRSDRITRLYKAIAAICTTRSIELAVYRLQDIKACFRPVGAVTRQEIAEAVARMIPAFGTDVPRPRKLWNGTSRRMALFCAAALVLTHYQLGASSLFNELGG